MATITSLPAESRIATDIVAWCISSPIYLASFMRALVVGLMRTIKTYSKRALFYNVFIALLWSGMDVEWSAHAD